METFSTLLALCEGNPPVNGGFPSQRPVRRSFDAFFDLHPNKRLSKQSDAGDLRRYRAHYDVTVMHNNMHIIAFFSVFLPCGTWHSSRKSYYDT